MASAGKGKLFGKPSDISFILVVGNSDYAVPFFSFFYHIVFVCSHLISELKPCVDILGNTQAHGVYFTPPSSVCMQCRCNNGAKVSCITIECQRPSCKNFKQVPGKCCDYTCPNGELCSRLIPCKQNFVPHASYPLVENP